MDKTRILVANTGEDSLFLKDKKESKTILLKKLKKENENSFQENDQLGPFDMVLGDKEIIYITNSYDNSIMKIDIENDRLLNYIKVGRNPTCIKKFDGKIYIANSDSNSISVVDEESFSLIEDISVGEKPTDIEIDEENLKVLIANGNCFTISVLDLKRESISSIVLSKHPIKILIEGKAIFVLSYKNNGITNYSNLSILDMETYKQIKSIDLKGIFGSFIKIKGKLEFYLTNVEDGYVYRVDLDKNMKISKIYLGGMPNNIVYDGGNRIFITDILKNDLTIIHKDTSGTIENFRVGKEPNGILLL